MEITVAVGFLVAYDYEMLKISLPLVYGSADKIFLGIDENRVSFTGKKFDFDETFKDWVAHFDRHSKIEWVEEEFYLPSLTPMENETRERNLLFANAPSATWYIQIDADEYFLDFPAFITDL